MSHTYNIECEQCYEKFCQCHKSTYLTLKDIVTGELRDATFCSESCADEWLENNCDEYKVVERD